MTWRDPAKLVLGPPADELSVASEAFGSLRIDRAPAGSLGCPKHSWGVVPSSTDHYERRVDQPAGSHIQQRASDRRSRNPSVTLYVGDDWAEDHHDIHLMDESGERLAARGRGAGTAPAAPRRSRATCAAARGAAIFIRAILTEPAPPGGGSAKSLLEASWIAHDLVLPPHGVRSDGPRRGVVTRCGVHGTLYLGEFGSNSHPSRPEGGAS